MRLFIFLAFLCLAGTGYAQQDATYRVDTLITFNPETMEEIIEVVVLEKTDATPKNESETPERFEFVRDREGKIMMDTLITFNPETMEEKIQIVKRMRSIKPD